MRARERVLISDPDNLLNKLLYYRSWFRLTKPRNRYNNIRLNTDKFQKRLGLTYEANGDKLFAIHKCVRFPKRYKVSHIPTGLGFPMMSDNRQQAILYLKCIINFIPLDWFKLTVDNQSEECNKVLKYHSEAVSQWHKQLRSKTYV